MDYYRKYVGDYARDTARLSMLEHGAYNLLLDHYYAEEKPIPVDAEEVCRIVRAVRPDERRAVEKILQAFFFLSDGCWHHRRVDHEIAKAGSARLNGRRGGRPTEQITEGLDLGLGNVTAGGSEANLQPPTSSNPRGQPPTSKSAFALPAWVPAEAWSAFVEMRTAARKPLTERAKFYAVRDLAKLVEAGQDPGAVLEQSVVRGWSGLFEVKNGRSQVGGSQAALEARNAEVGRKWLAKKAREDG